MAKADNILGWLLPAHAARRLGVSGFRLKQLASAGELIAKNDFHGRLRFDPRAVESLRERVKVGSAQIERVNRQGRAGGDGKQHAKAFRMFSEGIAPRVVVMETELTAAAVADLRRVYAEMGRDFLLTAPELEELRELLDWRGDSTAKSLFAAISAKMRHTFERGRAVAVESDKHTTEGNSSGNTHSGTEGQDRRPDEKGGAALRRDAEDGEADKPRVRGA